jgi:hypothetical protein
MTNDTPTWNPDDRSASERDIAELSRAILDGERAPSAPPPPPPARRIVPSAVKSLRLPAIAAQVMLAVWVPFGAVAVAFGFAQRSLLHRIMDDPSQVRYSELVTDQNRVDAINAVYLGLLAVTAIAFVVWFHRAYRNLDALDSPRRFGTGWAIGAWVVPVVNLYMPKRIADDIWAANQDPSTDTRTHGMPAPKSALIYCWWGAWIVAAILGIIVGRSPDPTTLQEMLDRNGLYLARDVALVVPAVLAIFVVRRVTAGQEAVRAQAQAHLS